MDLPDPFKPGQAVKVHGSAHFDQSGNVVAADFTNKQTNQHAGFRKINGQDVFSISTVESDGKGHDIYTSRAVNKEEFVSKAGFHHEDVLDQLGNRVEVHAAKGSAYKENVSYIIESRKEEQSTLVSKAIASGEMLGAPKFDGEEPGLYRDAFVAAEGVRLGLDSADKLLRLMTKLQFAPNVMNRGGAQGCNDSIGSVRRRAQGRDSVEEAFRSEVDSWRRERAAR
jgi:hypothetical protein